MTSRLTITLPDPDETEPKRWLCNAGNIEFEPAVSNEGEATIWLRDQALAPDDAFELAVSLLACWTHRDGLAKQEAAENDEVTADEHERTYEQSLTPPDLLETMRDHVMEQMSRGIGAVDAAERINSLPTVVGLKDTGGASVTINTLRDMGTSVNDIDPAAISRTLRSALQSLDLDETSGDPQ
jgi:hypothetical protein